MDAQLPDPGEDVSTGPVSGPDDTTAPRTGVPAVDEALADLDAAQRLPLEEQVAVFEQTQRRLRGALDESAPADSADL